MKRALICALVLALAMMIPACAEGESEIILLTVYQQAGWGDDVQAGYIDADGGLWTLTGSASALGWPYGLEAQLEYLASAPKREKVGELDFEALFDLKGLIASVQAQPVEAQPAANDAGTEISYALDDDGDGNPEAVCLGMSGDDVFENTDPNAQALYLLLRRLFPGVTCYGGAMGPAGFQPVPVAEFLGLDREAIQSATVREAYIDCEAGPTELEPEDDTAREIALNGMVTGKANASMTTGGTTAISFYDADGNWVGGFELYRGLLATNDGMYEISY